MGTTPVLALLVFWMLAGAPRAAGLVRLRSESLKGLAWVVLGFLPTILLPVRSSLCAVMPSVGVAMIAAAVADDFVPGLTAAALKRGTIGLTLVFVCSCPCIDCGMSGMCARPELSASIVAGVSPTLRHRIPREDWSSSTTFARVSGPPPSRHLVLVPTPQQLDDRRETSCLDRSAAVGARRHASAGPLPGDRGAYGRRWNSEENSVGFGL